MSEENGKQVRRLYRSRKDKMVCGICGGVAEYLEVDPSVVRLLWFISILLLGFGLMLYVIAWIIVPPNPHHPVEDGKEHPAGKRTEWNLAFGVVLLVLGTILLLGQFDLFDYGWFSFHFFPWRLFWPVVLIGIGVFLIASRTTINDALAGVRRRAAESRLRKSRSEKMVMGVCSGMGHYFRIDPTVVRVVWVVAILFSRGLAVLAYFVLALILPFEEEGGREETQPESQPNESRNSST